MKKIYIFFRSYLKNHGKIAFAFQIPDFRKMNSAKSAGVSGSTIYLFHVVFDQFQYLPSEFLVAVGFNVHNDSDKVLKTSASECLIIP